MMWRKFLMVLMLVAVAASLSACGRAGKPVAPDDADPKYPRQYPAPEPAPDSIR